MKQVKQHQGYPYNHTVTNYPTLVSTYVFKIKNKATLGMLVAITAFNKGNEVNLFLAADGTHLLNIKNEGEVVGQGTGDLKNT